MIIFLSITSVIATIIGLWCLGKKYKAGFMWHTVSVIIQAYLFFLQNNWWLIAQMAILVIFNVRNFLIWRKEDKNKETLEWLARSKKL